MKSLTQMETVPDGERFLNCAWFRCFRMAQGDVAKEDLLTQENKSANIIHKKYLLCDR